MVRIFEVRLTSTHVSTAQLVASADAPSESVHFLLTTRKNPRGAVTFYSDTGRAWWSERGSAAPSPKKR